MSDYLCCDAYVAYEGEVGAVDAEASVGAGEVEAVADD